MEGLRLTTAGALLPLHVNDLLELEVGGVGGEQTGSLRVGGGQADLGVDVQQVALAAARRHHNGSAVRLIVLEVITSHRSIEGVLRAGLRWVRGSSKWKTRGYVPEELCLQSSRSISMYR